MRIAKIFASVVSISCFFAISVHGYSGSTIDTIEAGEMDFVGQSMVLDSENNIYVLKQKGHLACDLTSNTCAWEWETGTGATVITAFSGIVQNSSGSGITVNVNGSGSVGRSINEWIHEFVESDVYAFSTVISLIAFYLFLVWGSLYFGFVYGFRFFIDKKSKNG